jgi:nucleotide-binding universal stress UspA family protein
MRRSVSSQSLDGIMPITVTASTSGRPVLVGTDLTVAAEEALRQGALLANDVSAACKVCHVLPELMRVAMLFPQWRSAKNSLRAEMTGRAHEAVRRELCAVLGADGQHIDIAIDSGTPHVGLLAQADACEAQLIVVGPGDTASQVVRHATVPVLVARPSPDGPVMGATDFSQSSTQAMTAACREAARRGAALHMIHVLDVGAYDFAGGTDVPPYLLGTSAVALDGLDDVQAEATRRLQAMLEAFELKGQVTVVSGHDAPAIVSYAESVDAALVVVGTQGRSGFARLTLGSTAADVVDSAPCSVLVARTPATVIPS